MHFLLLCPEFFARKSKLSYAKVLWKRQVSSWAQLSCDLLLKMYRDLIVRILKKWLTWSDIDKMKTCCIETFSKKFTKNSNKLFSKELLVNNTYLSVVNVASSHCAHQDFTESFLSEYTLFILYSSLYLSSCQGRWCLLRCAFFRQKCWYFIIYSQPESAAC